MYIHFMHLFIILFYLLDGHQSRERTTCLLNTGCLFNRCGVATKTGFLYFDFGMN